MTIRHIVQEHETLSSIAHDYGFYNWKNIYNAAENQDFRKRRPNPNLIMVGDTVIIPEKKSKNVPIKTGAKYLIKISREALPIEFFLLVQDKQSKKPIEGLTVFLQLPSSKIESYKTNSAGEIKIKEPKITEGKVVLAAIYDDREVPRISYGEETGGDVLAANKFIELMSNKKDYFSKAKYELQTNQSHVVEIVDKRAIVNELCQRHSMVRRSAWGARAVKYDQMEDDWNFDTIVVHDSGNGGEKNPVAIQNLHMDDNGWDDIAYQYIIRPDGQICEGRYLTKKSAANAGVNTKKIGILVAGDFQHQAWDFDDDVEPKQISQLINLCNSLKEKFPLITKLGGHRDFKDTDCPGDELYKLLDGVRLMTGLIKP